MGTRVHGGQETVSVMIVHLLNHKPNQTGVRVGRLGLGKFKDWPGPGWFSVLRGRNCFQIRVGQFAVVWKLKRIDWPSFAWWI